MIVLANEKMLADKVRPANGFFSRFKGLMGVKTLNTGEGLLLFDCSSIHCFFMKIAIDVVYISSDMRVLGVETVQPWRVGHIFRGAKHVLELPAGSAIQRLSVGDVLNVEDS